MTCLLNSFVSVLSNMIFLTWRFTVCSLPYKPRSSLNCTCMPSITLFDIVFLIFLLFVSYTFEMIFVSSNFVIYVSFSYLYKRLRSRKLKLVLFYEKEWSEVDVGWVLLLMWSYCFDILFAVFVEMSSHESRVSPLSSVICSVAQWCGYWIVEDLKSNLISLVNYPACSLVP